MNTSHKILLSLLLSAGIFAGCQNRSPKVLAPDLGDVEVFALNNVKLLESPFKAAQETDLKYIKALNSDRLLAPFVREAGLEPRAASYGNWENTGLDGHIGGHYLSALAMMYASTGDEECKKRLNYMVGVLAKCQETNGHGYVGGIPGGKAMWDEVKQGNIDAGSFSLNGKWVPLYNIHKLFAGLKDAYLIGENEQAKEVLIKLSDWMMAVIADLSDDQVQDMLRSEHGGMNEVFVDVYKITGDEKYLETAKRFSHQAILDPLLAQKDELTGIHANTQIPKVIGFKKVADAAGLDDWNKASAFFWETVVNNRSVSIGGNSVREHFNPKEDFSSMISSVQGPETCNTYNMLKLSELLFQGESDARFMDYYERGLFNHILSTQHPDGGFVYFTPMRPQHYRVYSQPETSFWCCVGSGLENHSKYGEMIYAKAKDNLFVNLFIASEVNWEEKGVTLTQATRFPEEGTTTLKLSMDDPTKFILNIRYPGWVPQGDFEVKVNGKSVDHQNNPSSYLSLENTWQNGDEITVTFPMDITLAYLPADSSWVSIMRGPIVMAAVTDSTHLDGLFADDSRMAHVASGEKYPLEDAPYLVAASSKEILDHVTATDGGNLVLSKEIVVNSNNNYKLYPFYQVHDARYIIYWPTGDAQTYANLKEARAEEEGKKRLLDEQTIDQVATGEQQPEAEHNFKGEHTNSGNNNGHFWRDATGWFSYDLRNKNQEGKVLRVTYFTGDAGRDFKILLNDKAFQQVSLTKNDQFFYDVDYAIPSDFLTNNQKITVRFEPMGKSIAGGVYYLRLMKGE